MTLIFLIFGKCEKGKLHILNKVGLSTFQEILAKLSADGVDISAVRFIYDCLINQKQRIKIEDHYSSWRDLIFGVPQGSIL